MAIVAGAAKAGVSEEGGAVKPTSGTVVATQVKRIGRAGRAAPAARTVGSRGGARFVPPPPGFVPRDTGATAVVGAPEAVDPTTISSITKTPVLDGNGNLIAWDLTIAWSGGTAPYSVVKSINPSFEWGVQTLGKEISGNAFADQMAKDTVDNLFFNVTDLSVISPAVQGLGYEPEPSPGPPSLANPYGWWGSMMQINASYLDPIAPANLSFFNRVAGKAFETDVPSGSSYSTWAKFVVPRDARSSFPATVQAHSRMSPGSSAVVMDPSLTYANIHGVVWAPQTGRVWVADDNLLADVDLFRDGPTSTSVVTDLAKPYISRVSDNGILVLVDGTPPPPAVATVYQVDVTSGVKTPFAATKDDGFSRDITPVGIALSADGLVAYVADAQGQAVVKIPKGAGPGTTKIVDHWGGKSNFEFLDPAGIDVAPTSQVLVANNADGRVWELIDAQTGFPTDLVGTGVHVLAIDRELSEWPIVRYMHTPAPAAAEAFNLNVIGFDPPAYHGSVVYGATDHLELYPEDRPGQIYTIEPRDPQRVIISSSGGIVPYTSPLQFWDRVTTFTVDGWPGLEVRLKLIDPPDTAPYAPDGGWDITGRTKKLPYEANDNAEDLATVDVGLSLTPFGPWSKELDVTPDGNGTATVYLEVTDRYAGDNYQVEVMKCLPGGCAAGLLANRVVALSPIFTAWKRIHIERDKMFRNGGVLAEDYVPQQDCGTAGNPICDCVADPNANCCKGIGPLFCNQIVAYEWQNAAAGDQVAVFDELSAFERLNETRWITAVGNHDANGLVRITLDQGLDLAHLRSARIEPDPPAKYQPTFSNHHSAGYGVISNCDLSANQINAPDSCFYQADLRGVEQAYNDAFVEVYAPRGGMTATPFLPESWFTNTVLSGIVWFNETWFEHLGGGPPAPEVVGLSSPVDVRTNYLHVIGATKRINSHGQTLLGMTLKDYNFSYIFRQTVEEEGQRQNATRAQMDFLCQHTTVHETGHQFDVNMCTDPSGGHDTRDAWCGTQCEPGVSAVRKCVMGVGAPTDKNDWDGVNRFCVDDLFPGDPACPPDHAIRREPDPL